MQDHVANSIDRQCEALSKEDLQSLIAETRSLLLPLDSLVDSHHLLFSNKSSIDAWNLSFDMRCIQDHALRNNIFLTQSIQKTFSRAVKHLHHADLLDHLSIIIPAGHHNIARSVNINPPENIVIVINELRADVDSISKYFHETGHGIHFAGMDKDILHLEKTFGHTWMEAMAFIYEDLFLEPGVLHDHVDSADTLDDLQAIIAYRRLDSLRKVLLHLSLQLGLYEHDESVQSLDDFKMKIQNITQQFFPYLRNISPFWWANDMYVVEFPFYGINYLYGWMIAAQIRAWWKRTHSEPILSKAFGDFLRTQCYPPGNSIPWREQLQKITGEDVNPVYLVRELSQAKNLFDEITRT